MDKAYSNISNDFVTLKLPTRVSFETLDLIAKQTKSLFKNNKHPIHHINIDLSEIGFIDPEGAVILICFCAAIRNKNPLIQFHLFYPKENVLQYLVSLGFFGQMSNLIGVLEGQDLVQLENERRFKRKSQLGNCNIKEHSKAIILPIQTIPKKKETSSGRDFENMASTFVNYAISTLNELFLDVQYNLQGVDQRQFILSNRELFKNIFEHSNSWGLATVHARPNYGTTVCYCDIGIGFKGSVEKFNDDEDSIKWALIDGNSSKNKDESNDGYGLTIVQNLVLKRGGVLKIRSGECLLNVSFNKIEPKKVIKFPGVQLSYFIPYVS